MQSSPVMQSNRAAPGKSTSFYPYVQLANLISNTDPNLILTLVVTLNPILTLTGLSHSNGVYAVKQNKHGYLSGRPGAKLSVTVLSHSPAKATAK